LRQFLLSFDPWLSKNEQEIEKHVTSVCYIDAALQSNAGHHANSCRHFVGEFRRRGFVVHAYGNRDLDSGFAQELRVQPLFRHVPYIRTRGEGRLSYFLERSSFLYDVKSAWNLGPYDIMFFHSPLAAQFAAVALWLRQFQPDESPFVAVGFDTASGNKLNDHHHYYARFYRKAGKLFRSCYLGRTLLFTFDPAITDDYAELLNLPIQTMPAIHAGLREPRLRERDADGLITVAFLGHQRTEKGYHLIPEIVRQLLGHPLKLLIHNSAPVDCPAVSQQLRALASENPRVAFVEKPGDQLHWQDLLDRSDLIVLPYEPNRYRRSGSGVATEAVSEGIPMVVPPGSTMETLAITYQGCATTFSTWDSHAVTCAIERAVANFEILAKQAEAGAVEWRHNNGVGLFVDRFLKIATFNRRSLAIKPRARSMCDAVMNKVLNRLVFGRAGPVRRQR
jgi:glycosyltransferase involved in cell wall biosynthesis